MAMCVRGSSREDEGLHEISYICILTTDADFRVEALQQVVAQYAYSWILDTELGRSVHQHCLDRRAQGERHQDLFGWRRSLDGRFLSRG